MGTAPKQSQELPENGIEEAAFGISYLEEITGGEGFYGAIENNAIDQYVEVKRNIDEYVEGEISHNSDIQLLTALNLGNFEEARQILSEEFDIENDVSYEFDNAVYFSLEAD